MGRLFDRAMVLGLLSVSIIANWDRIYSVIEVIREEWTKTALNPWQGVSSQQRDEALEQEFLRLRPELYNSMRGLT